MAIRAICFALGLVLVNEVCVPDGRVFCPQQQLDVSACIDNAESEP